jgi:hypothetical protein
MLYNFPQAEGPSEGVSGPLSAPVSRRVVGVSFEIVSFNGDDAGSVAWEVAGDD